MYKIDDKIICIYTISNFMGDPIFEEGKTYKVLNIDGDDITLNHNLYANEYNSFKSDFIRRNFKTLKEMRKIKIKSLL